jgi:hypothetical protein
MSDSCFKSNEVIVASAPYIICDLSLVGLLWLLVGMIAGPGLGSGWLLLVACFVLVMVSEVQNTHVKSSQGSQANHGSRCQVQQYLPLSHCTPHVRAQTSLCGMSWHWHWWWLCARFCYPLV